MVQYKWVALSNTTIGMLMASLDASIVMIALPAIFNGIGINPFTSFQYMLWILFGYGIVTATLLVTFGRLSDMFGRVKLYNLGFAIFTVGSILLSIVPDGSAEAGAMMIIIFRIIQGIGGAFLFSNSAAIITDAFPENERGKALGINSIAFLVGNFVGLVLGGILAIFDWHLVFLVSVPVGILGTIWSYWKLKEQHKPKPKQKLDIWGNISFGVGLTVLLIGITYGLTPFTHNCIIDPMGWANPWVITALVAGIAMLLAFPFIERKTEDPMFRLDLFKIRAFAAGNLASFAGSLARGGVMIMLIILLQGIWLPLHWLPQNGLTSADAPFWAGIFMLPMTAGFVIAGPLSGILSDKYGARGFATGGLVLQGICFLLLCMLPVDFEFLPFALIIFAMGIGGGFFMSPNVSSVMGSLPPEHRGVGSGMRGTIQNFAMTISQAIFFTMIIVALNASLPSAIYSAAIGAGASTNLAQGLASMPASSALFAAFLGYPLSSILPAGTPASITNPAFFPNAISGSFMGALTQAFLLAAALCFIGAIFSGIRGKKPVPQQAQIKPEVSKTSQ
jgi:EmrB/QacA subfamily drug resistance transporter